MGIDGVMAGEEDRIIRNNPAVKQLTFQKFFVVYFT